LWGFQAGTEKQSRNQKHSFSPTYILFGNQIRSILDGEGVKERETKGEREKDRVTNDGRERERERERERALYGVRGPNSLTPLHLVQNAASAEVMRNPFIRRIV
jgi:hypothetical protein